MKRREIKELRKDLNTKESLGLDAELIKRKRSLFIRHLDCGSCNGCELELNALTNSIYDIASYGIHFEASPRHADVLAMTGVFTRNLAEAARLTLEAMPTPQIIAVGDCAIDGGIFKDRKSYAIMEKPEEIKKAIINEIRVPGCPPEPGVILKALLKYKHAE